MAALRYMSGKQLSTQRTERERKLEWIKEQVATGDLVIRQATAEECARYGISAAPEAVQPAPQRARPARRPVPAKRKFAAPAAL